MCTVMTVPVPQRTQTGIWESQFGFKIKCLKMKTELFIAHDLSSRQQESHPGLILWTSPVASKTPKPRKGLWIPLQGIGFDTVPYGQMVVFRLSRTLTFPSPWRLSILAAVCIALALRSVARPSLLSLDLSHDGLAAPCSAIPGLLSEDALPGRNRITVDPTRSRRPDVG